MLILASEDIGNANPTALVMANATFEAVNKIGYPESSLILSQCAIYLASSAKSNSATVAIGEAMAAVRQHGDLSVPLHHPQCTDQVNEGPGLWQELRIFT